MTYNTTNDLVTRSESDNWAGEKVVTLNTYDGSGHSTSTVENCTTSGTTPSSPASSCTAAGTHDGSTNLTTSYVYTANDQIDVQWDPRGFATKHQYDANGNETATIANCREPSRQRGLLLDDVTTSATFDLGRATARPGSGDGNRCERHRHDRWVRRAGAPDERDPAGDATIPVLTARPPTTSSGTS